MKTKEKKMRKSMLKEIKDMINVILETKSFDKKKPGGIYVCSSETGVLVKAVGGKEMGKGLNPNSILVERGVEILGDNVKNIFGACYLRNGESIISSLQATNTDVPEEEETSLKPEYSEEAFEDDDEMLEAEEEEQENLQSPIELDDILEIMQNMNLNDHQKQQILDVIGVDQEDEFTKPKPLDEVRKISIPELIDFIKDMSTENKMDLLNGIKLICTDEDRDLILKTLWDDIPAASKIYEKKREYLEGEKLLSPEDNSEEYMANAMTKYSEYAEASIKKKGHYSSSVFCKLSKDAHAGHAPLDGICQISKGICPSSSYTFRQWENDVLSVRMYKAEIYAALIVAAFPESGYNTVLNRMRNDETFLPYVGCPKENIPQIIDDIEAALRSFASYNEIYSGKARKKSIVEKSIHNQFMKISSGDEEYGYIPDTVSPTRYCELKPGDFFMIKPVSKTKKERETFVLTAQLRDVFIKMRKMNGDASRTILNGVGIMEYIAEKYNDKEAIQVLENRKDPDHKERNLRIDTIMRKYECIMIRMEYRDYLVENKEVDNTEVVDTEPEEDPIQEEVLVEENTDENSGNEEDSDE